MNVSYQFLEIGILLTNDGFVPILKQVPVADVAAVEGYGISGQKAAHEYGQPFVAAAKQDMGMIVHQCPGVKAISRGLGLITQAGQEIFPILIVVNDIPAFDAPQHNVVQCSRGIQPCSSGHWTPPCLVVVDVYG